MNQLLSRLQGHPWTLLVSLPQNDPQLARAAIKGGAQGLKVHLNVEHFASGTHFGTLAQERVALREILTISADAGINVGVVPGAGGKFASVEDFEELAAMGVDYFDAYPADAPAWALTQNHLDIMLAAYQGADLDEFAHFEALGMKLCEASILPHEEYGKPLTALDLARYAHLHSKLRGPIIVPSQKKVVPADVPALRRTGVKGLLIGAIVTGRDAASVEAASRAFRLDALV